MILLRVLQVDMTRFFSVSYKWTCHDPSPCLTSGHDMILLRVLHVDMT